jgi:small GTP-binding protein
MSINAALAPCEWREKKINLVDCPGYLDFVGEVGSSVRVTDATVIVLAAPSGVEVGTETGWALAAEFAKPRMLFVNKMDRENDDFGREMEGLQPTLGKSCVPIQIPVGAQDGFAGIVDIVHGKAYTGSGRETREVPIPDALVGDVETWREQLMEAAAEADDALIWRAALRRGSGPGAHRRSQGGEYGPGGVRIGRPQHRHSAVSGRGRAVSTVSVGGRGREGEEPTVRKGGSAGSTSRRSHVRTGVQNIVGSLRG